MKPLLAQIKAVVFDLDNTLVSSSLNFKAIKQQVACPADQDLLEFVDQLPLPQQQHCQAVIHQHEINDANSAHALPGCQSLLNTVRKLGLHTAIVTRNCAKAAAIKLKNNQLVMPIVLTRDEYPAKPAPDALLHLAEKWQIKQTQILYVGDYLYDVQLAENANAKSCLLSYQRELSFSHRADVLVDDLNALNTLLQQECKPAHNSVPNE